MNERDDAKGCCTPSRGSGEPSRDASTFAQQGQPSKENMRHIPGGSFDMGGEDADGFPADGEGPVRSVEVASFLIDACAVTAAEFACFVERTGYVTDAERYGWSFVFASAVHPAAFGQILEGQLPGAPWWLAVKGACWKCPDGPGTDWRDKPDHPVVHVSWNDAQAYASAGGKRLPTEAEWEKAARGGRVRSRFPWGDELEPEGRHMCNVWQGSFPTDNTAADGYLTTAPARSFEPNGYGLYNAAGNIWEWCNDGWSATWHAEENAATRVNPAGPTNDQAKVIRGGSYLCHASYCNRYRLSARTFNSPDSSTGNTGFRCAL